ILVGARRLSTGGIDNDHLGRPKVRAVRHPAIGTLGGDLVPVDAHPVHTVTAVEPAAASEPGGGVVSGVDQVVQVDHPVPGGMPLTPERTVPAFADDRLTVLASQ